MIGNIILNWSQACCDAYMISTSETLWASLETDIATYSCSGEHEEYLC